MTLNPFDVRAAWTAETLEQDRSWVLELNAAQQQEVLRALQGFKNWAHEHGLTAQWLHGHMVPPRESFPLPTLGPLLTRVQRDLEEGYGVGLLRGFPVAGQTTKDLHLMHAGVCAHVGTPVAQTVFNEKVQDLRDVGQASLIERRGSKHNRGLPFHNDPCDVVSFLCIQPAAQGGVGQFASSVAIHNAMLATNPEHVETLYQPLYHTYQEYLFVRTGSNQALMPTRRFYPMPAFTAEGGQFACKYSRFYIDQAQEWPDVPRLSATQQAALDTFENELHNPRWQLQVPYQAGDVVWINNYVCFHARTPFVDDPQARRHMLRIWLSTPNSRPLAAHWLEQVFFQERKAGGLRGGVPVPEVHYG